MSELTNKFWFDDPSILFNKKYITNFFPTKSQTLENKFNSVVRLSFYCSVILFIYHNDINYFFIFIGSLLLTYFIYNNKKKKNIEKELENKKEELEKSLETLSNEKENIKQNIKENIKENDTKLCVRPTLNNPFMNVTMDDMLNFKDDKIVERLPACDTNDPVIKAEINKMYENNLYKDVNDLFGKFNSQRQFYTMPSTTIPNAQNEFAKWLYLNPKTCKEDQDFCLKYEDIRAKRPIVYDSSSNPVNTKK